MAEEHRLRAALQHALQRLDAAAVPVAAMSEIVVGVERVIKMHGDRHPEPAAAAKQRQRIGVVIHHAQLHFAAQPHAVDLDGRPHPLDGAGLPRVRHIPEHKPPRHRSA